MLIKLKTQLPKKHALSLMVEIIKYAKLTLDVDLDITSFGEESETNIHAINNVITEQVLDHIIKEQRK